METKTPEFDFFSVEQGWNSIILRFKQFFVLLKKCGVYIFIFGLLGGVFGFLYTVLSPVKYNAKSRFIVREAGSSVLPSTLSSLGSFLGATGTSSIDRTIAYIGSEKVIGGVILSSCDINGTTDLVINHIIRANKLSEKWKSDSLLADVNFQLKDSVLDKFDLGKRKAYKTLIDLLVGEDGFVFKSFDKKSGVITLEVKFCDEFIATKINELIVSKLISNLKEESYGLSKINISTLQKKIDSINSELSFVRKKLAKQTDQSFGLLLNQDRVTLKELAIKEQILLTMYGEAQKNLESILFISGSNLSSISITLLDSPITPLKPLKHNKLLFTAIGFLLSVFLSSLYFLRNALKKVS